MMGVFWDYMAHLNGGGGGGPIKSTIISFIFSNIIITNSYNNLAIHLEIASVDDTNDYK